MTTVHDIARFIETELPSVRGDQMKLQKLVYYSQAWSLVWDRQPLFPEKLEAWKYGPVSPELYAHEKRNQPTGSADALSSAQAETVRAVVRAFGDRPAPWLKELSHRERPWLEARQGIPEDAKSNEVISEDSMFNWYSQHRWGSGKGFSEAYLRGLALLVELPVEEVEALSDPNAVVGSAYLGWLEDGDEQCLEF